MTTREERKRRTYGHITDWVFTIGESLLFLPRVAISFFRMLFH